MSAVSQILRLCIGNCQVFETWQWKTRQEEHFDSLDSSSVNIYTDKHGKGFTFHCSGIKPHTVQCLISPVALLIRQHVSLSGTKCPSKHNSRVFLSTQTCVLVVIL